MRFTETGSAALVTETPEDSVYFNDTLITASDTEGNEGIIRTQKNPKDKGFWWDLTRYN